jgi:hypothetical protein
MLPLNETVQPIRIIRLALIAGVLMFGVAILVVHGQTTWKPKTLPPAFGYALVGCAIAAVWAAISMRGRVMGESEPGRRASLLVIGWVIGESAALFGGVLFLITGQSQWYLLGLLAMGGAFVMLPAKGMP